MFESGMTGLEESLQALGRFSGEVERSSEDALKYVLQLMLNYVKENGPWTDRTAALRNSISINLDTMQEWPSDTSPETLAALAGMNETPVIIDEGSGYVGCISAGMEYAIWVETKEGFWVLSGAIDHFEPLIEKYFADRMSVEKLDLEEVATIAYLNYQTNKQFGR